MQATERIPEHADDGRFFAIPFAAIAGFEDVAATARSLATLPPNIDLDHFARADEDLSERRRRLLTTPDIARMSFYERRRRGARVLATRVQRIKEARGHTKAAEERREWRPGLAWVNVDGEIDVAERHEWRLGSTNYYFKNPSPRIAPLRHAMDRFFGCACRCIGDQFYSPGAFRDWHTDRFSYVGWIVFLVEVAQPGRSSFRYMDPASGDLVVVPDRNDMAYFFRTSAEEPLFWHGVLCEATYRWSQGFSIPQDWRARIRLGPAEGA